MPDELRMVVDGMRYGGWKSIRVTQSMESIAGSFALETHDRWGERDEPWPIAEEDPCRIEINDVVVIDGYVDTRDPSLAADAMSLSYSGKDKAAAIVENSALIEGARVTGKPSSAKWTYRNVDVLEFARAVCAPFGIRVSIQSGLVLPKLAIVTITPGDKGFDVLSEACSRSGVLAVSDARGGIVITRGTEARARALVQGENVRSASMRYDGTSRFYRYVIASQIPGTDEAYGSAANVQAEAFDLGVRRRDRVLLIRPDKGYNAADARRRADWEARNRAARSEQATVVVQGWRQPDSSDLWSINTITAVDIPRIGIIGDMLISQVEFSVGPDGTMTTLSLVRPDAFEPEPTAVVKAPTGGGGWKELEKGGTL